MKFKSSLLFSLLLSIPVLAQTRVVVLDTGLDIQDTRFSAHICNEGHKDFTNTELDDVEGHGTHIVGLIQQYAGDADYCLIIVKYYKDSSTYNNMKAYTAALKYSFSLEPAIINFSGIGPKFDEDELLEIQHHPEVVMIVAAGNEGTNLDEKKYYPASYEEANVITIGSIDWLTEHISKFSNYGKVVKGWEVGEFVKSTLPKGQEGYMQGTSMSTAIFCGKKIREISKKNNN